MRLTALLLVAALAAASAAPARAQLWDLGALGGDLNLPAEPRSLTFLTPLSTGLFKPEGAGPFPAVVIYHSCGGLRSEIHDWAKRALAEGYVALVIDALGPRGVQNNCYPPLPVSWQRLTKDAFDALEHLRKLPYVDGNRVGLIGFSQGAMVGMLASSVEVAKGYPTGSRFGAVVSLYGGCSGASLYLRMDTDRPLLALMGELDNETPAFGCIYVLENLRTQGAPVEWHVYPAATHCWDCRSLHNLSKRDWRGQTVVYRYDRDITEDSVKRAFAFLGRRMAAR